MSRHSIALFLAVLLGMRPVVSNADPDAAIYRLNPGDTLLISVWGEENLQSEVLVRPDGGISFPLAGEVKAAGRALSDVEAELAKKLSRYIPEPLVTVAAKQLLGNKVYVIGKVNRAGEFPINRPTDVVQALAMAGGMTPYAATGKIKVLRREGGALKAIPFDYGEIEKGRNLAQNIVLKAGDVVVVP